MADNFQVTAGSGTTVATKDASGVHHPKQLMEFDVGGTPTMVSSSAPLPVVQTGTPGLPTGAATAAKQAALGTAGTASADVYSVQGIASMTPLKVDGSAVTQPVSGTFWQATQPVSGTVSITANSAVNLAQLAGTTTDTNSGSKSAGTLRVVLATDQPALTNKLLVTPDANSAVNIAQINGVTPLMGAGNTGTGSPRVTIASDQAAIPVTAAGAVASGATDSGNPVKIGGKYNSSGATLTDGQRGDLQLDARANAKLTLFDVVEVTGSLTVSTSAYAIGDAVGGKITFSSASLVSAGWCRITGIAVTDQDKDMPSCVLTLFTADPSGTTVTDNAALDIADADMGKIVKAQSIVDWVGYSDNAICTPSNVDIMCKVASGTSLYGCFHTLQAFTPAATTDWSVKLTIERYL